MNANRDFSYLLNVKLFLQNFLVFVVRGMQAQENEKINMHVTKKLKLLVQVLLLVIFN